MPVIYKMQLDEYTVIIVIPCQMSRSLLARDRGIVNEKVSECVFCLAKPTSNTCRSECVSNDFLSNARFVSLFINFCALEIPFEQSKIVFFCQFILQKGVENHPAIKSLMRGKSTH